MPVRRRLCLILLDIPSVVIGFMTIQPMLFGDFFKGAIFIDAEKHAAMQELAKAFHGPVQMALHALSTLPFWLAVAGVALLMAFGRRGLVDAGLSQCNIDLPCTETARLTPC